MNKSVLPLLMFPFITVLTLKLLLEMAEHALWVTCGRGVDQIFHWIGQHVVLHSWTRKSSTGHLCQLKWTEQKACLLLIGLKVQYRMQLQWEETNRRAGRRLWDPREC